MSETTSKIQEMCALRSHHTVLTHSNCNKYKWERHQASKTQEKNIVLIRHHFPNTISETPSKILEIEHHMEPSQLT